MKQNPALISLLVGTVITVVACDQWTRGKTPGCVGPYCGIECQNSDACPTGSWCDNGQCTTEVSGGCDVDPDGDGYCECCSLGRDCGEGNPAVNPGADEFCDGVDNDCDGKLDRSACEIDSQGTDADPFDGGGTAGGIVENPDGSLTLGSTDVATDFAWPSNDHEGTVSRIDTIRNVEVGRYASVLRIAGGNPADANGIPNVSEWDAHCNRPSRSTVDLAGNAYVANRAHVDGCARKQGHITKIGFYDHDLCQMSLASCQCKDRNDNGTIETSRDLNEDSAISLVPADGEFLGYDDECLLWTVPIGGSDSNARAMAIDADGFIWVGDWQGRKFFKLNPVDGSLVNPFDANQPATGNGIDVEGRPYGAVVDSKGGLWYANSSNTGQIQRIDTKTGTVDPMITDNPAKGYGITIDRKDRVWLASWDDTVSGGTVARYNPATSTWNAFGAGLTAGVRGRGVSATAAGQTDTGAGVVWAAFHGAGIAQLVGFDDDSGAVWASVNLAERCGAQVSIGIGIGTADSVWVVNQDSDNVCSYDPHQDDVDEIAIGRAPYTYSDFTGNVLRTFTAPQGTYRSIHEGCPAALPRVAWSVVTWEGATPGDTSIQVSARSADSVAGLATATPIGPAAQPPDRQLLLAGLSGDYLEVLVTLVADESDNVPTLFSLTVGRECNEEPQ